MKTKTLITLNTCIVLAGTATVLTLFAVLIDKTIKERQAIDFLNGVEMSSGELWEDEEKIAAEAEIL